MRWLKRSFPIERMNLAWLKASLWGSPFWRWSFWALVLITLWLSLIPGEQIPKGLHFWDKAQHAVGFAALCFLGLKAYPVQAKAVLLSLALFGVGIEVAQWLTGWRHGDWQDWMRTALGLRLDLRRGGWRPWR